MPRPRGKRGHDDGRGPHDTVPFGAGSHAPFHETNLMKRETTSIKGSVREPPGDYDEDEDGDLVELRFSPHGGLGSAGYVSGEKAAADRVQRMREVVAEVTRGRIVAPKKRGPGF